MTEDAGRGREWFGFGQDPKLVQEWLRQNNLAYGGLIAIGCTWSSRSSPPPRST
jgi:hypothetical protein